MDDVIFSLLFINGYNAFSVLFPYLFGLQSPKVFYICHLQLWLWLLREPFVFIFNLKFLAQEPLYFFSKIVVSLPVLVSS